MKPLKPRLRQKLDNLITLLKQSESSVLAFSGGLDSGFLLKAISMSGISALAVTSSSPTTPRHDLKDAVALSSEIGIRHRLIDSLVMENDEFMSNNRDRCFHCKDMLYARLDEIKRAEGYKYLMDGSNTDDLNDHRPGLKAAAMRSVRSPLIEAGFSKKDVRDAAGRLGMEISDKPASPCLSSRIPFGVRITLDALRMVSDAEEALRAMGFNELRVRHYGSLAKIEVPVHNFQNVLDRKDEIVQSVKRAGYIYASLDLEGLTSGNLNKALIKDGN